MSGEISDVQEFSQTGSDGITSDNSSKSVTDVSQPTHKTHRIPLLVILWITISLLTGYIFINQVNSLYLESTSDALRRYSLANNTGMIASLLIVGLCICGMLLSKNKYWLIGSLPAIFVFIITFIMGNSLLPEISLILTSPILVTLFFIAIGKPMRKFLKAVVIASCILGFLVAGYAYYHENRTGILNPYTQECIKAGMHGARGNSCF